MNTEQPAFPTWARNDDMTPGMTLRDFFANTAMQAMIATGEYGRACKDVLADDAYEIADAMLKAREQ